MSKISAYTQILNSALLPSVMIPVTDPNNTTMASTGTTDRMTIGQLLPGVVWPSGDTSGAKDAAAVSAAVSALPAKGGVVTLMSSADWYIACGSVSVNRSNVYISAPGCYIWAVGAGDVFRIYDSSNINTRAYEGGGLLGWPVIDGANTTGNSSAVHAGDIFTMTVCAQPQNFHAGTTSKGVWFDNNYYWSEMLQADIRAYNCTAAVVFDVHATAGTVTGSYDRSTLVFYVEQGTATYDGVVWQAGSLMVDGKMTIRGNFNSSGTTLTSALLRITGTTPGGVALVSNSTIITSMVDIGAECAGGTYTPQTIVFGAGSNQISQCYGQLDFAQGSPFAQSNNASNLLNFYGPVAGDPALISWLEAVTCNSSSGAQAITSATAAAVAKISGPLGAYQVSRIRAWVPYSAAITAGTPVFSFTGPGGQLATNLAVKFFSGGALSSVSQYTSYTSTFTGPTLTSSTSHLMEIEGTVLGSVAGTLQLTAAEGTGGDSFTVEAGAYMSVIQSNY
jgi:hypothetical protein